MNCAKAILLLLGFFCCGNFLFGAQNTICEYYKIEFQPHGVARADIEFKYGGRYSDEIKQELSSKSKEDQELFLKERFLALYKLTTIDSFNWSESDTPVSTFNQYIKCAGFSHAVTQFENAQMIIFENAMVKPLLNEVKEYIGKKRDFDVFKFEQSASLEYRYDILFPEGFVLRDKIKSQKFWIGPLALIRDVVSHDDKGVELCYSLSWGGTVLSGEDFDFLMENIDGFSAQQKPLVIELLHKGKILYDDGHYSAAVAYHKSMVDRLQASPMDYCRLANCYLLIRQGTLARKIINQAVKRFSDNALVWFARGIIYQHNESGREYKNGFNYPEAEISFRKAFELDSANTVYNNTIFNHLLYDFRAVSGGSATNLEKAKPYFRDMLKSTNHNTGHLTLAWYLDDYEAMQELSFSQNSDGFFIRQLLISYRDDGIKGVKKSLVQKKEELKSSTLNSVIALFWGKAFFDEAIEIYSYTKDWELIQSDLSSSFDSIANNYDGLNLDTFDIPIDELLARSNEDAPKEIIKRFFYELYVSDGKHYLNLKPMMSNLFFEKMAQPTSSIGFNTLFEKVVKAQTLSSGTFESRWKSFILSLDVSVVSFNNKVFDISVFSSNPNPTHFWAIKKDGEIILVGYDFVYPGLGEELIYLANDDVDSAKELLKWVMDFALSNSDDTKTELEDKEKNQNELDLYSNGIFSYYLKYRDGDPMKIGEVSFSEVLVALSSLSEIENSSLWNEIEKFLEKLRFSSNPIKQKMAYKSLASYHYDMGNKEKVVLYGHQFYNAFPDEPLAIRFELVARLLEGEGTTVFDWIESQKDKVDKEQLYYFMVFMATSYLVDSSYLVENIDDIMQGLDVQIQATLYNLLAWMSLFEKEKPTDRDFFYARKAVELSDNKNRAIIHTLATLYAFVKRSDDALKLLDKIETISDSGLYTDSDWFLYGLIMDNFGQTQAAQEAFEKCKNEEQVDMLSKPLSCARLVEILFEKDR